MLSINKENEELNADNRSLSLLYEPVCSRYLLLQRLIEIMFGSGRRLSRPDSSSVIPLPPLYLWPVAKLNSIPLHSLLLMVTMLAFLIDSKLAVLKTQPLDSVFLDVTASKIAVLPSDVLSFGSLSGLYLKSNLLTFLPEEIFEALPSLQHLDLRNNRISQLPPTVGKHRALRNLLLQVGYHSITGSALLCLSN